VDEGEPVREGQLVAELDPERYEEARARAAAQVAAQERVVAELLAGSRPEEIQAARARVDGARASLGDAEQIYRRSAALARSQYVSQQKLESSEAALKSARANLDAQKQAFELALKGPRQEDIDAARAKLQADQASLRLAEKELADTRLVAP
jgi:HlyD family secretion protein